MPTDLGGEGPTFNPLDWYHTLLESSQTQETEQPPRSYCITQTAVYSQPPPNYVKPIKPVITNNNNKTGDPARNTLLGFNNGNNDDI